MWLLFTHVALLRPYLTLIQARNRIAVPVWKVCNSNMKRAFSSHAHSTADVKSKGRLGRNLGSRLPLDSVVSLRSFF